MRVGIAITMAFSAGASLSSCNRQVGGTGRKGPDGSEIARTGIYNGQDTHGEGVGTVNEKLENKQNSK
jgi:hypothetical protein